MKIRRIIFFCMAIVLNPGASAELVGTLPAPQAIADFTDGWIDLSVSRVQYPAMYNFKTLQLSMVPGLNNYCFFSYIWCDQVKFEGGGSDYFTSEFGYISGQINLWRMGAPVGTLPIKLGCAVITVSLGGPQYFGGSVATQTFSITKGETSFLGLGKSTIGKGPLNVFTPFDEDSRLLPYVNCHGDFDSVTVNLSGLYCNWFAQDGVGWADYTAGFYLGILSTK